MALETERSEVTGPAWSAAVSPPPVAGPETVRSVVWGAVRAYGRATGRWLARQPIPRYIAGSLLRRILVSNLLGLGLLLLGLSLISQYNAQLIHAKRDSLITQGETIAAAIASNAFVDNTGSLRLDPDRLPHAEGALIPFRDDGFSALELSIHPDRVMPVLRRLMQHSPNRARIYARDGTLIADTSLFIERGQILRDNEKVQPEEGNRKVRNFWTRLTQRLLGSQLRVYTEIGAGNGTAYQEVRSALTGITTPLLMLTDEGEQIVSVAVPIKRARNVQGVLLLSTRPGDIDDALDAERNIVLMLAALALIATLAASALLARTVAGPMRRLSEAADLVSRSLTARHELPDYSERGDEVGQMSRAFRSMTAALYRRIEASEKFAADVAHELKNPLTAARSTAESLSYARTPEQRDQLVTQIQWELKRLNRLITDVANASRLDAELARQQTEVIDLAAIVEGVVNTFDDIHADDGRRVLVRRESATDDFMVIGHEGRIGQVITNLVDNAISFSPENGTVQASVRRAGDWVEIAVEDEGSGILPDKLEKVFERFYTDRPATEAQRGKNSGLGLSISREIVRAHGGRIWAENRYSDDRADDRVDDAPIGARFVIHLPSAQRSTPAGRSAVPVSRRG